MIGMKDIKEKIFGVHSPSKEWHMIEYIQVGEDLQKMTINDLWLKAIDALNRADFSVSSLREMSITECVTFHADMEIVRSCLILIAKNIMMKKEG